MLKIVTDGAADMPDRWEKTYDIKVIQINIHFGGRQPRARHRGNCCLYQLIRIRR